MCDCPEKYIKVPKWSCVFFKSSECPGVFVPDTEINDNKDIDILFIRFFRDENVSFCSLHKQLLPENGKTCHLCMNL